MNVDLTFNSVAFKQQWSDQDKGSSRISTARGINTPDFMKVRSQAYIDSTTKVPGQRFNLLFLREDLDANSQKIVSSAGVTIAVPSTVTDAQLAVMVATLKAAVADADLLTNILAGQR